MREIVDFLIVTRLWFATFSGSVELRLDDRKDVDHEQVSEQLLWATDEGLAGVDGTLMSVVPMWFGAEVLADDMRGLPAMASPEHGAEVADERAGIQEPILPERAQLAFEVDCGVGPVPDGGCSQDELPDQAEELVSEQDEQRDEDLARDDRLVGLAQADTPDEPVRDARHGVEVCIRGQECSIGLAYTQLAPLSSQFSVDTRHSQLVAEASIVRRSRPSGLNGMYGIHRPKRSSGLGLWVLHIRLRPEVVAEDR